MCASRARRCSASTRPRAARGCAEALCTRRRRTRGDPRQAAQGRCARDAMEHQPLQGLGEMSAEQLWDTTMNPDTRRLMPVKLGERLRATVAHDDADGQGRGSRARGWLEERQRRRSRHLSRTPARPGMTPGPARHLRIRNSDGRQHFRSLRQLRCTGCRRADARQLREQAYLTRGQRREEPRAADVCDGQKPVQRRILYAMNEMGLGGREAGEVGARGRRRAR